MIALQESIKAGLFTKHNLINNIFAGIIVGIVALPLAMAFAIASGARPESGLYTAIISALIVAIFGGSRVQIAGPTGAFIVILANITGQYGFAGLQLATLVAGGILIILGVMRLGTVIKYIPQPVIAGFTIGIGVIIFVGQWKYFFGLPVKLSISDNFYQKITQLLSSLPQLNIATTLLGIMSIFLVVYSGKFIKKIPGPLVAMIVITLIQKIFSFSGVATIGSVFGTIPSGLPPITIPHLTINSFIGILGPAFTIALLGAIESLLSATAADRLTNQRHNPNQELIGQGIANCIVPFFCGFASTGAIARTATNIKNGGNSPLAAIVHSIFLLLIILFLAPLASYIPLCALAAILFVVAYNMSDIQHVIYTLKHSPIDDKVVLISTFILTVVTDLVIAVNIGIVLALLFFMRRVTATSYVQEEKINFIDSITINKFQFKRNIIIYKLHGPFFFGVAEKFTNSLKVVHNNVDAVVFDFHNVPFVDFSGLHTFQETIEKLYKQNVKMYLYAANYGIRKKFTQVGIKSYIETKQSFSSMDELASHDNKYFVSSY